jgi:hypothetical protein
MKSIQQVLSDLVSMFFSPPENKEVHGWGTIIGVLSFLVLVTILAKAVRY